MRKLKRGVKIGGMSVKEYETRGKSGQILVVVLLVIVVVLAIGLSVASRNLTSLKSSTQAEQSQRAFTAAEGGVENTLSRLGAVANLINTASPVPGCSPGPSGSGQATCTLGFASPPPGIDADSNPSLSKSNVVVKANNAYERVVDTGDVAQINLKNVAANSVVTVKWSKIANPGEQSPNSATLEFTFVCSNSTASCAAEPFSGVYGQHREAITIDTIASQSGGFKTCGTTALPFISKSDLNVDTQWKCVVEFTLPAGNFELLRIRPFWNQTTLNISVSGITPPVQTYVITSTATTDSGLTRKVQVERDLLPQLPAIFDYVLYSGGDIIK